MRKLTIPYFFLFCVISLTARAQDNQPTDIELHGTVTNVTAAQSSGVTFHITSDDGKTFRAKGAYDSIHLSGRFDIPGIIISKGTDFICFQFAGDLDLGGNDGTGLPEGTKVNYVMSIMYTTHVVKGVYHIGKYTDSIPFEQYGVMELSGGSKKQATK
jgi:hypothetical protein